MRSASCGSSPAASPSPTSPSTSPPRRSRSPSSAAAQFRGRTSEEEQGWLFAIARSQLSHFWRRGAVERAALTRLGIPVVTPDAEELERIEALADLETVRGEVAAALGALSGEQREAVQMRVVGEMDYADIAVKVGVTEDVVRARVSRGLRTLATDLTPVELRDAG